MSEIQSYDPSVEYHEQDRGYPSGKMIEDTDGDYVLYTDHLAMVAEKEREIIEERRKRAIAIERIVAITARVKELEQFSTNIGDCGYVAECRKVMELTAENADLKARIQGMLDAGRE